MTDLHYKQKTPEESHIYIDPTRLQELTPEQAWFYKVLPKQDEQGRKVFYVEEGADQIQQKLEMIFDEPLFLSPIEPHLLKEQLEKFYKKTKHEKKQVKQRLDAREEHFLADLILEAKRLGSSDIHLESFEESCQIRLRIDGQLIDLYELDKATYPSLINKIKIQANLDIAEKRLPQDGRIPFKNKGKAFDIRVSVLPTIYGEKVVMRLLLTDGTAIDLDRLGFRPQEMKQYLEAIRQPNGLVLISGPTGSGKTTTLYASLKLLNKSSMNITTIEDPVEYTLKGINQVQVNENIGLSFAKALRTFLRQDPDIIMVGEIRDEETANIAVRAALTGHLVLSTIHTNSALGTISRLMDMGIPPFLLADTLNISVAQRLLKKVCPHCQSSQKITPQDWPLGFRPPQILKEQQVGKGCDACMFTGYKGRLGIYEILRMDEAFKQQIITGHFNQKERLEETHLLSHSAFELLYKGQTSLEEAYPYLM